MGRLGKVFIILLLLAGLVMGGWFGYEKYGRKDPAAAYRTMPVHEANITSAITATGTVVPEDVVDVGAQVNGQIASFGNDKDGKTVDYRSTVDEGMVLANIDQTLFAADVSSNQAQLDQAQAQVRVAEASRDQAKAKLDQAQRDWERAQKLGQSAALAQVDYDAARSNYEQGVANLAVQEASIGQAQAQVSAAQASLLRAQRNLSYTVIKSPVSGTIIDRRVDIGQTVVASLNAPSLFLIAKDLSRMQVLVQVNEADIGNVHPGQDVTFTVDAFPTQTFRGQVRKVRLNATMTQNVVTYTVEIVTDNSDLKLLPYLTANVRFIVAQKDGVLAVPNAALRWSPRDAPAPAAGARTGQRGNTQANGASGQATQAPANSGAPAATGEAGTTAATGADAGGQRRRGGGSPGSGGPGNRGQGGERKSRGEHSTGTVYVLENGQPKPITVRTGLTDGSVTEVQGEGLTDGAEVIVSEAVTQARGGAGGSPFTPQIFRGGGGGRGGR